MLRLNRIPRYALIVGCISACIPEARSQPKAVPPSVPANYPILTTPASLGAAPGSTLEIVLTGANLTNATAVAASFPCKASIVEPTQDATKLKVKFEVPKDTPIGMYYFRVATEAGPSNLRPFLVDTLPIVAEKEGNTKKDMPQAVKIPCVISGTASAEAGDFFKFQVNAGQTLTLESLGRRIGSPIDPVLIVYDAKGNELPGLWADDTPGLQTDARITHAFPIAGEFIVEIRDTTYRGGADYAYRLRIGEFAGPTSAFPVAIERGKKTEIGFAGPKSETLGRLTMKAGPSAEVICAIPPGKLPGWPLPVRVSEHPELLEQEPNNTAKQANTLTLPGGISAKFAEKNDIDFFKFAGKKGQKVIVQALSYELNLPTEVYVRILDSQGKELMKSDPQTAGVRLEYTPTADGDLFIACEQNNYAFGSNEIYHLSVKPASPDFSVALGSDRFDLPLGGVAPIPISAVTRTNGFNGPIELAYRTSKITIPAGATPTAVAPFWFPILADKNAELGMEFGTVTATATIDGKVVSHPASTLDIAKAALGNMPSPPVEFASAIAVAIVPAAKFQLELVIEKPEVSVGGSLKGKIRAKRSDEVDGEIVLAAVSLPAAVTAKFNPIPKGKSEAEVELTFPAGVSIGASSIIVRGTSKVKGKEQSAVALPVDVKVTDTAKKSEPKKK